LTLRDGEGSFWDHLEELRSRIIRVMAVLCVLTAAAFVLSRRLMALVLTGVDGTLQVLAPQEAITAHMKLALTAAVIVAWPYASLEAWLFLRPGLLPGERRAVKAGAFLAALLFLAGAAFGWQVLLRPTMLLFRSFEGGMITGAWTLSSYISFLGQFLFVMGVCFELPLVVLLLSATGIVDPRSLGRYRRHVIVGLLVLGAVLPPNDPVTQLVMAVPLYVLFELSLLGARLLWRRGGA
jgi:sec-independent protein translocase protein TatC